jgi:ABC-type multidrug transport system ATPase subunit
MEIILTKLAKRFSYDWIFKNVDFRFENGQRYAILGPNGSGKSTLMKVLSGHLSPSKGEIVFMKNDKNIDIDDVYKNIAYSAPYIELIEEFTLQEAILLQQRFKPFLQNLNVNDLVKILGFEKSIDKEIRFFSSGMKQRLKLALSICADTPLLLLDEPTTNLDEQGAAWYRDLLQKYGENRTVIVATNVVEDYAFYCQNVIKIADFV